MELTCKHCGKQELGLGWPAMDLCGDCAESSPRLLGRCVEVGDDDEGQPRLVIHTTREQLRRFARNLAFADVEVRLQHEQPILKPK